MKNKKGLEIDLVPSSISPTNGERIQSARVQETKWLGNIAIGRMTGFIPIDPANSAQALEDLKGEGNFEITFGTKDRRQAGVYEVSCVPTEKYVALVEEREAAAAKAAEGTLQHK